MSKKDMILAMIEHYSNGNKAQFASRLGITPQGLSTWIKRESFDIELVFSKCENLSAQWLLTGKGEMLKTKGDTNENLSDSQPPHGHEGSQKSPITQEKTDNFSFDTLLATITKQAEEIGRLKARIDELERRRGDNASDASIEIARAG